jgi:hypothetical protein
MCWCFAHSEAILWLLNFKFCSINLQSLWKKPYQARDNYLVTYCCAPNACDMKYRSQLACTTNTSAECLWPVMRLSAPLPCIPSPIHPSIQFEISLKPWPNVVASQHKFWTCILSGHNLCCFIAFALIELKFECKFLKQVEFDYRCRSIFDQF